MKFTDITYNFQVWIQQIQYFRSVLGMKNRSSTLLTLIALYRETFQNNFTLKMSVFSENNTSKGYNRLAYKIKSYLCLKLHPPKVYKAREMSLSKAPQLILKVLQTKCLLKSKIFGSQQKLKVALEIYQKSKQGHHLQFSYLLN